jgi:hypothetical protein
MNFYSKRWISPPSRAASVCTHKEEFSDDSAVIDECKALTDVSACNGNTNCQFTLPYGVKFEKSGCGGGMYSSAIIKAISGKTPKTCDEACTNEPS